MVFEVPGQALTRCAHCGSVSIWMNEKLIYPPSLSAPQASQGLPADARVDYDEARAVEPISPRAAAALLRLCVEKLCHNLGGEGADQNSLNENIGKMVQNGLAKTVQQSLDIVRVTGNESVHPGQMDLLDDKDTVLVLFEIVNLIVQQMITTPAMVAATYAKLPEDKRKGIEDRDQDANSE